MTQHHLLFLDFSFIEAAAIAALLAVVSETERDRVLAEELRSVGATSISLVENNNQHKQTKIRIRNLLKDIVDRVVGK